MKKAMSSERKAGIGVLCTMLAAAPVLGPVYERQPDSFLALILTVLFAVTILAFAFHLPDVAVNYVRERR